MPQQVWLHVGSPKTGTTFLQSVIWNGRESALAQGLLLPLDSFQDHFLASVDLRDKSIYEQFPSRAIGMWERLAEQARGWPGDVLVSHELFAGATAAQAATAVRSFGDADVHVVVTARDLERQIPAEWQEHIKHRSTLTFDEFVHHLRTSSEEAEWFWTVQDTADVCRRWGAALRPGNVHVVTVPRETSGADSLWTRFATLIGIDPEQYSLDAAPANTSLHAEQAELLRRFNAQLGSRFPMPGPYPVAVKDVLAQDLLAARPGTAVGLVGEDRKFAVARAHQIVDELDQLGVQVVGSRDDLVPPDEPTAERVLTDAPEAVSDGALLNEGLDALTGALARLQDERAQVREAEVLRHRLEADLIAVRGELSVVQDRLDATQAERDRLVHDMRHRPVRHLMIGVSEAHPGLMKVRVAYWRTANLVRRIARLGRR
jgi:hypothetical protein